MTESRRAILDRVRERDDAAVALLAATYRQWWRVVRNSRYKGEARRLLALSNADLDALPPLSKREREREMARYACYGVRGPSANS